jgi:hypothetical protein
MYDPLVVDTFVTSYAEIGPIAARAGQEARTIFATDSPAHDVSRPLQTIRDNASEAALLRSSDQLIATASANDAFELAVQSLRQLTPATVYALYEFESRAETLVCRQVAGDPNRLLHGLIIPFGQRVSGWAAANRRTAVNSDASLDLAQIARAFTPRLHSA